MEVQKSEQKLEQSEEKKKLKIGIDFGGVCCYLTRDDNDDTQKYDPNFKEAITMDGCIDALKYLVKQGHKLYLISFCGKNRANATRNMLCTEHSDLFKKENLFFVKKRWFKSKVCNHLGLDVLIDDRIDIITSLRHVKGIQFRGDPRIDKNITALEHKFLTADSWKDVISILNKFESLNLNPREEIDISALCHWEKQKIV